MTPALRKYASSIGVRFLDRTMVTDLLQRDGAVRGAIGFSLDSGASAVLRCRRSRVGRRAELFPFSGHARFRDRPVTPMPWRIVRAWC